MDRAGNGTGVIGCSSVLTVLNPPISSRMVLSSMILVVGQSDKGPSLLKFRFLGEDSIPKFVKSILKE